MKILQWLRKLHGKPKRVASEPSEAPVRVQRVVGPPPDDEMMAEAIRRCWNSGNMVIGNRDAQGNVTMTEHPVDRRSDQK